MASVLAARAPFTGRRIERAPLPEMRAPRWERAPLARPEWRGGGSLAALAREADRRRAAVLAFDASVEALRLAERAALDARTEADWREIEADRRAERRAETRGALAFLVVLALVCAGLVWAAL